MVEENEMIKKILRENQRSIEVERYALEEFLRKTSNCLEPLEVEETLRKNHYNGIYLISESDLRIVEPKDSVQGLYNNKYRIILLDKEYFYFQRDIAVHEITHAYLNGRNKKKIDIANNPVLYGVGLEEGFASLVQSTATIDNIDNCQVNAYPYQSKLFKQLNVLYDYSDYKKYPNLMHHMLKEPNDFLSALSGIYESILSKILVDSRDISLLSLRSASVVVNATDIMLEEHCSDKILYQIVNCLNTVYLALADRNMRDGHLQHDLFPALSQIVKSSECRLLSALFGDESDYFKVQIQNLTGLIMAYLDEIEQIDSKNPKISSDYIKVLKK